VKKAKIKSNFLNTFFNVFATLKKFFLKALEKKIVPLMKALLETWYTQDPEKSESYCRIVTVRY
jgi:hypothetical protein